MIYILYDVIFWPNKNILETNYNAVYAAYSFEVHRKDDSKCILVSLYMPSYVVHMRYYFKQSNDAKIFQIIMFHLETLSWKKDENTHCTNRKRILVKMSKP